ncbi:MAG: hypothetical protein ACJ71S_14270 [Acidobacteriaceae bacterium]
MAKRTFLLMLVVCVVTGTSWAADDAFVGKWKLNPSKSVLTDEMKVASVGANKYAFDFGGGDSEIIVIDGTDQPGLFHTTLSVTATGPDAWTVVRKKDGRTLITGNWKLSPDGNTLTDTFRANRPDGSISSLDYIYKRTAGTTGFAGTWESTTEKVNSVYELQMESYENDGLSFINPSQQSTRNMKFDGKDYPNQGPNLPPFFMTSGHRVNERTLELTDKIQGKIRDTQQIQLSADGKTLTTTVHPVGQSKPNILVFDRE